MKVLLGNQKNAISKLNTLKVGALFMEAGTGKTRTACELIYSIDGLDYILWITPFNTKENLLNEIKEHGKLINVNIVGIESLQASDRIYLEIYNELLESNKAVIVCDESLKIKNFDAKRTKRMLELSKLCEYKLILNGTPITRNLLDLWSQFQFLSPSILNMAIGEFKNTFCEWTKITKRQGNITLVKEFITRYHNVDYLYSIIEPYVFECDLKLDVKTQYHTIDYKLDDDLFKEYTMLKEKYLDNEKLQFLNNNIFLELTQKMQHTYCLTSEKLEILDKLIKDNDPNKVIVFCKYINSREAIEKLYPNIMVLSYQKHSLGLNLQYKNIIVYFDKTFDYSLRKQSERRTYRTGQQLDCVYYDLTGNVGLEKMIDENINKKQDLLDYFKQVGINQIKKQL